MKGSLLVVSTIEGFHCNVSNRSLISSFSILQRFGSHFSDALRKEYSSKGIIVQVHVYMCRVKTSRTLSCFHPTPSSPPLSNPPPFLLLSSHLCPTSQDVRPFMVATAMIRAALKITSSRLIPDPITYTRAAVATIGIQHTTYGYFYHALQVGGALLPLLQILQTVFWSFCVHSKL